VIGQANKRISTGASPTVNFCFNSLEATGKSRKSVRFRIQLLSNSGVKMLISNKFDLFGIPNLANAGNLEYNATLQIANTSHEDTRCASGTRRKKVNE